MSDSVKKWFEMQEEKEVQQRSAIHTCTKQKSIQNTNRL